jgi:phosphoglycolate phosphatase
MEILDQDYKVHRPKAIIFDWDNTLIDSWDLVHESVNKTLVQYGKKPWSLDKVKINIHRSMRDTLFKYFPDKWEEVGEFYRECYSTVMEKVKPLPDAELSLQLVVDKGIYCTIVSNKKNIFLNKEIKKLKWNKYFQAILGSGDLEQDKPSPMGVYEVLKNADINPSEEVWFVGDTVTDMETAYNAKCLPVFFGEEECNSSRYDRCKPKVIFRNHALLSKYLESL